MLDISLTTNKFNISQLLASLFVLLVAATCSSPAISKNQVTAIINAVVIDGNGGEAIENASLVIEGNTIKAIGRNLSIPKDAQIIDAKGKTVMPGLADMHVHLSWGGEGFDLLGYQRRLNAFLYSGVTTIFDTGGMLPFVQQIHQSIENGKIIGPHLTYVGPLIDSADPRWPEVSLSMVAEGQAEKIAKYLKKNGVAAIKAYAKLNRAQIVSLVQQGKKLGLPVILDAWFQNGAEHLVTTGIRAFAHTPGRLTEDTLSTMKNKDVFIITTRAVGGVEKRTMLKGKSFINSELVKNTTPPWLLAQAKEKVDRTLNDKKYAENYFSETFFKKLQGNVKRLHDHGIKLVAGTDNDGLFAGESIHFELELLVDAGLTPLEAITTATKNAALMLNQEKQWGTLEPGKRADVLIINGRPDKNISDIRKISMVIKNGKIVDREKLVFSEDKDIGVKDTSFGVE